MVAFATRMPTREFNYLRGVVGSIFMISGKIFSLATDQKPLSSIQVQMFALATVHH